MLVPPASAHLSHHHRPGVDARPHREPNAFLSFQARVQHLHGLNNPQAGAHRPLGIVFMRLRKAKIDEQAIAEVLGNITVEALDDGSTGGLIGADHVPQVFGIELAGEFGRVRQVTEHHRELAAFGVRRIRRSGW
jgi:hypothetical protein